MSVEKIAVAEVDGYFHPAQGGSRGGLVITHGAGGNCTMQLLVSVAETFAAAGIATLRCDLAFRRKRPSGGPHPSGAAADRQSLADAVVWMRQRNIKRVFLGGQSYGGRQASMLAAEQPGIADALLLLSYPLHPPGQAAKLRTDHFPLLRIPALFVHGTKDPFGTPEEMLQAMRAISSPVERSEITGAGHDLAWGKFDIGAPVVQPLLRLAGIEKS